ncbi:hypothetical protein [Parvibaculum sp.]|uniref:hypothetical protein n=1 Tax=Parvibaculum sp. TaxID=2024848 RepID=UPI0039196002
MIRFALKMLLVMVAAGYFIRQAEPASAPRDKPNIIHASYMTGTDEPAPAEVARHLSSFANVQIVFMQASRDIAGFCDRQALACEAGRELVRRAAAGIRDASARLAGDREEQAKDEAMPLLVHRGNGPVLPAAPPPRYVMF